MTKKELTEFVGKIQSLPDDTPVVFDTDKDLRQCAQLKLEHISILSQPAKMVDRQGIAQQSPATTSAIVINAFPKDWLEREYHITIEL